jgi:hypothetical protein
MGDDQAQFSFSTSVGSVIGDAPAEGLPVFRASDDSERLETMTFGGAFRFADRLQAGLELPLIRRTRETETISDEASGLGDIRLVTAYEIIPDWSYSSWRPHGFLFFQLTLPTGPSVYDASSTYLLDARGRGFLAPAVGAAFTKLIGNWDFLFSSEIHHSFSRQIDVGGGASTELSPGWGGSAVMGIGYAPGGKALRLGLAVAPVYEGPISASGGLNSLSSAQLVWNTSLALGYAINSVWSAGVIYTDQTWLGPVENVSLSRTIAMNLQKRWEL